MMAVHMSLLGLLLAAMVVVVYTPAVSNCDAVNHVAAATMAARHRMSVAVLDFGEGGEATAGGRAARHLAMRLAASATTTTTTTSTASILAVSVIDPAQSRAAARGIGYQVGMLNMTLAEARDLGAAIGCDFYITGEAQTLRRSPSANPVYIEAYASIFIVERRTGKLIMWDHLSKHAPTPEKAEQMLFAELDNRSRVYLAALEEQRKEEERRKEEEAAAAQHRPLPADRIIIEDAPDGRDTSAAQSSTVRPPQPFRRLRPAYPATAAAVEAEATVDIAVEITADGEVSEAEIVRWAGFGLDEAVIRTVRQLHFRPALRDGLPVPARVLLRYNFRRPSTGAHTPKL